MLRLSVINQKANRSGVVAVWHEDKDLGAYQG